MRDRTRRDASSAVSAAPPRRRSFFAGGVVALAISLCALCGLMPAAAAAETRAAGALDWVATWGASPQQAEAVLGLAPSFNNQSVRMIVRISTGGKQFRVKLTNLYGNAPLVIGAAHLALWSGRGSAIRPATDRALTFSGNASITIPPGAPVLSDPVDLKAGALSSLVVSLYLPEATGLATWHAEGRQTAYIADGDQTAATAFPAGGTTSTGRMFLTDVFTVAPNSPVSIVTFGDSITDGYASSVDKNLRWPDRLAERLQASGRDIGVVNQGISGNRVLHDNSGPNGLSRFDRDVLSTPGVRFATVLLGINDIGLGSVVASEKVSAGEIIAGHRQMIAYAHSRGIRIYGATLTPIGGSIYDSAENEAKRRAFNHWIRTSGEYDGVIDFDKVVRDPADHSRMLPLYNSGDSLHPSDAGYRAMGDAIDLRLFDN